MNEKGKSAKKRVRKAKTKRMTAFNVFEIILKQNIKNITELHAHAQDQRDNGKTELCQFILCKAPRAIEDLIETTWRMKAARKVLVRAKMSRIELVEEARRQDCASKCNGAWLQCATEILDNNGINQTKFGTSVLELLKSGRGKHRNLMIVGPANCGKTFILKPLTLLFQTF